MRALWALSVAGFIAAGTACFGPVAPTIRDLQAVPIVVFARDLPDGHTLGEDDLELKWIRPEGLLSTHVQTPVPMLRLTQPGLAGEPLRAEQVQVTDGGSFVSLSLPPGPEIQTELGDVVVMERDLPAGHVLTDDDVFTIEATPDMRDALGCEPMRRCFDDPKRVIGMQLMGDVLENAPVRVERLRPHLP